MITVVDYGMGNLRSVVKAVELYTPSVGISSSPDSLENSSGVILPGDGAFARAMENLNSMGWTSCLKEYIRKGGIFMGICLGFQLMFSESEEFGQAEGLDLIKGRVLRFDASRGLKVPHMGWNSVSIKKKSPFLEGVPDGSYFYFIHSYYPATENNDAVIGTASYGIDFPCIIGGSNYIATQFHPEKSHTAGLRIIENFVKKVNEYRSDT